MARRFVGYFLLVCFVLGVLAQVTTSAQYLETLMRNKVWANRQLDAVARSADVAFGEKFSGYIRFLRDGIPEVAKVVIPAQPQGRFELDRVDLMEYFLFPRRIRACSQECASRLADPNTYIVVYGEFPPRELVPPSKRYLLFRGDLGLYVPENGGK